MSQTQLKLRPNATQDAMLQGATWSIKGFRHHTPNINSNPGGFPWHISNLL
ncbi:MAG TPA: hypothetical protein VKE24_16125 [Candidatus Acidoferrales bacterium]|nr:hypothetical protein [Candidatus Acidoferrales bacterium]